LTGTNGRKDQRIGVIVDPGLFSITAISAWLDAVSLLLPEMSRHVDVHVDTRISSAIIGVSIASLELIARVARVKLLLSRRSRCTSNSRMHAFRQFIIINSLDSDMETFSDRASRGDALEREKDASRLNDQVEG